MTRALSFAVALITTFVLCLGVAAADPPEPVFTDADLTLMQGDTRYYEGDYYRALTSYKDFLWRFPNDYRADRVRLKKAWVHYAGGEYRQAANILDRLAVEQTEHYEGWWARHYFGLVAYEAGRSPLARTAFLDVLDLCQPQMERVDQADQDPDVATCVELTARARLSLARVSASRHNFDEAHQHLSSVPPQSRFAEEALDVADHLDNLVIPRKKSPALAGTLSIIPGLGHLYIGETRNAIFAMAWNGIFIYGLVDSILSGNYGQAALIGLLETIWYSGTIFGAVAGAHRYNRDVRRNLQDGLIRDINHIEDDQPWPARFPARTPGYLELRLDF